VYVSVSITGKTEIRRRHTFPPGPNFVQSKRLRRTRTCTHSSRGVQPALRLKRDLLQLARKRIRQANNAVIKWAFLIPPNFVDEAFIGGDKSTTIFNR
jgi:hypothetical protein